MRGWRSAASVALVLLGGGWLATRAGAAGAPPPPGALYYSGELTSAVDGTRPSGPHDIAIRLFDRAESTGAVRYCEVIHRAVDVSEGHFRVSLDRTEAGTTYLPCADAFRAHPQVWLELEVNGDVVERRQVGAVPYALETDRAIESGHAEQADRAVDSDHADDADHALAADSAAEAGRVTRRGTSTTTPSITAASAFCGYSAPTRAAMGGYAGAHALCATACGSSTAHMCSSSEITTSLQVGFPASGGGHVWYAGGARSFEVYAGANVLIQDCLGWTDVRRSDGAVGLGGPVLATAGGVTRPEWDYCDTTHRIACCD